MRSVYNVYHRMYYRSSNYADVQMAEVANEEDVAFSNKEKALLYAKELCSKYEKENSKKMVDCLVSGIAQYENVNLLFQQAQQEYGTDGFRHAVKVLKYVIQ